MALLIAPPAFLRPTDHTKILSPLSLLFAHRDSAPRSRPRCAEHRTRCGISQKSYSRCCGLIDNPLTHPARASREASREARVGQPDPLASRARCGQGDRPSPHGMRETVCGISRFLKWPDRNPVLGLSRSGPVPRLELRRPTPRNPSASCFTLLFAPSDSASRSRPLTHAWCFFLHDAPGGRLDEGESPGANKKAERRFSARLLLIRSRSVGAGVRSRAEPDRADDHAAARTPVVGAMAIAMPAAIVAVPVTVMVVTAATEMAIAIVPTAMLDEFYATLGLAQSREPRRCGRSRGRRTAECSSQCQKSNKCKTLHHEFLLAVVIWIDAGRIIATAPITQQTHHCGVPHSLKTLAARNSVAFSWSRRVTRRLRCLNQGV